MLIRWWCIGTITAMYRIDGYLTLITGQGASIMTYRAVEPKTSISHPRSFFNADKDAVDAVFPCIVNQVFSRGPVTDTDVDVTRPVC